MKTKSVKSLNPFNSLPVQDMQTGVILTVDDIIKCAKSI